jgi:histidinol-phosphate aminotransferase
MHLNEFRGAHAPSVLDALAPGEGGARLLATYPSAAPAFSARLALYAGVPGAEWVAPAAGSDEVLRAAIDTCALRGQAKIVVGVPTYTHFTHYARLRGLELAEYPLGAGCPPPVQKALLEARFGGALEGGALVYIGSPNNPTAEVWGRADIAALAARFPRSTFLVDEAYIEFAGGEAPPGPEEKDSEAAAVLNARSAAPLVGAHPNLIVSRTFSKAFGLAGLRAGYAVAAPPALALLHLALNPKAFTAQAERAAGAVLDALPHYLGQARKAVAMGAALAEALGEGGWSARRGPTNFLLVYAGDAPAAVAFFRARGLHIRDRSGLPGLEGWVRVTVGKEGDPGAVLAAFGAWGGPGGRPPGPPPEYSPRRGKKAPPPGVVYVDGVFDLFHAAHLEFLRKARAAGGAGATLVAGVMTDEDAGWKRPPIVPHAQRVEMLRCCSLVDRVVAAPPLVLTAEFLGELGATCVVHGDDDEQAGFFAVPRALGLMRYVSYTRDGPLATSTTEIVKRVRGRDDLAAPG